MDKILVTGGAGFIGSNLCEALLKKGHKVVCLDNLSTGVDQNVLKQNNFTFVQGDANNPYDLNNIFNTHDIDTVFHYAAVVGVKRTIENPLLVFKDIEGIKTLLDLSRKHDVKKLVFSSSSEVYGEPVEIPEKEDGILNAKMPYALVKLLGEQMLRAYYEKYGLKTTSLRFFNVYGPRQISTAYGFVVGIFIKQVLANTPPTIFGDGKQTRDFMYIEDNVNAAITTMESDKTNGESINIGTGKETTILELANTIIEMCEKDLKPKFQAPLPGDIRRRCTDITKMKKLIGYTPEYSLKEGLKKTIDWYKNE